jgi:hypothetical protein
MRMNEISTSRSGYARIIHLSPSRCDNVLNIAPGYHKRTPCDRNHVLPCEP